MGLLLVYKKKLDKRMRNLVGNQEKVAQTCNENQREPTNDRQYISLELEITKLKGEIKETQRKAKGILTKGNEYKANNPASCQYAYVQF